MNKPLYVFHITTTDDVTIEWRGLTRSQAESMYKATQKRQPNNIRAFGWAIAEGATV